MPPPELADGRAIERFDAHGLGTRDHAAGDPLALVLLKPKPCERIGMRAGHQRGHLAIIDFPFCTSTRLCHGFPGMIPKSLANKEQGAYGDIWLA